MLEGQLANAHKIASSKRTAFAARLKNFHRLGFPTDLNSSKGRRSLYSPGQVVEMAIAVELTQLGLTPERVVRVLTLDPLPLFTAVRMAASCLILADQEQDEEKGFMPMYLYFDPATLADLTVEWNMAETPDQDRALSTFFYGGPGVVADMLATWTAGENTRAAFLNVTAMLDGFAGPHFSNNGGLLTKVRRRFLEDLLAWADEYEETYADEDLAEALYKYLISGLSADVLKNVDDDGAALREVIAAAAQELNTPERLLGIVETWIRNPESRLELENG